MTELLQQAFDKASELPQAEQDSLAQWLLEGLASEIRWDALFSREPDLLAKMADEALAEHRRGETLSLDSEKL